MINNQYTVLHAACKLPPMIMTSTVASQEIVHAAKSGFLSQYVQKKQSVCCM